MSRTLVSTLEAYVRVQCTARWRRLLRREGDVDRDHHDGEDDAHDHQLSQGFAPLQYGISASFLKGMEPSVEPARGDELVVGSFFGQPAVFEDHDLVDVFN